MYAFEFMERMLIQGFNVTVTTKSGSWNKILDLYAFYDLYGDQFSDIKLIEAEGPYGYMRMYL